MRRLLTGVFVVGFLLAAAGLAFSQATVTPNIGLQIPAYQQSNWQVPIDYDLSLLDNLLGGTSFLPTGVSPSVSGSRTYVTQNTSATVIGSIGNGYPGQVITLFCGATDTFTSVSSSATISLNGTWICPTSGALTLTLISGVWQESSREVGSGGGGGGGGAPCTTTALSVQYDAGGAFGCIDILTYNSASHTLTGGSGGTVNFGPLSHFIAPFAGGFTASASGSFGLDTTLSNWHFYNGSADHIPAMFQSANPTNGDCPQIQNSGGTLSLIDYGSPCNVYIDVKSEGAKGDVRFVTDGAMSNNSFTLTSVTANFTSADVGKTLWMINTGNLIIWNQTCGTQKFVTTIASVTNSTTVVLADEFCSGVSVSGDTVYIGTDDTSAINTAFTAAVTAQTCVTLHAGNYLISAPVFSGSTGNVCVIGAGPSIVSLDLSPAINWPSFSGSSFFNVSGASINISGFTVDGLSVMQGSLTNVIAWYMPSGFYYQDVTLQNLTGPTASGQSWDCASITSDGWIGYNYFVLNCGGNGLAVHSNYTECFSCRFGAQVNGVYIDDGGHDEFHGGFASGSIGFNVASDSGSSEQGEIQGMVLCGGTAGFQMTTPASGKFGQYTLIGDYIQQYDTTTGCGNTPPTNASGIVVQGGANGNTLIMAGDTVDGYGTGVAVNNASTVYESGWNIFGGTSPTFTNSGSWYTTPRTFPGVNRTAQTSSLGSTAITTTAYAGMWQADVDLIDTTAGTGGTVTASVINLNGTGTNTQTSSALSLTGSGELSTSFKFYSASGQNISYSTTVSGATGSPQYALRIRLSYLGP